MKLFYKLSTFAWGAWWLLLFTFVPVESGPLNIEAPAREVTNNSLTDFDLPSVSKGCRYKTLFYNNGEEVSTDEPCLACQCKGTVVVCKLRICPETPVPPPPGCIVVHKAKSCCSHLVCHGQEATKKISREQRFPVNVSNETVMASVSNETKDSGGYCVLDGTVYAEGSAMRSSTLCQYCFCIRGEMKCSSPQCVIPMNGCKPRFRSYACCPTNYDCGQSNETAILKTLPSSTQVPQFLKGCLVNNQFVPEGEPVLPVQLAAGHANATSQTNIICQTCFCMGGVVHCRPLECDQPIDGCEPIKEDGHCCPDRYDCTKAQQKDRLSTPTTPSAKKMFSTSISTSAALLSSSAPAVSSSLSTFPVSLQTTELPEEISTETVASSLSTDQALGDYVPVSITTTATLYDDVDSTTTGRPNNVDSFERIATIMADSSEEKDLMIPVRKVEPVKKARISITTIGGFKNRSDLGSREERRSKDADELSPKQLQQSFEDDERDEYYNFPVFDTTLSNAIEDLGATTTFDDSVNESTPDPELFDIADTMASDPVETENPTTDNNIFSTEHDEATVVSPHLSDFTQSEQFATSDVSPSLPERNDDLLPTTQSIFSETTGKVEEHTDAPTVTLPSLSSTSDISTTTASTSTNTNLEFIPFVEDDAYAPMDNDSISSLDNANSPPSPFYLTDTIGQLSRHGFYQNKNISLLKPLELKFFNGTQEPSVTPGSSETEDALPILVEKDALPSTQFNIDNISANLPPASSSLYNNGYYPHGSIIIDDGPADVLHVAQGEVSKRKNGKFAEDDNIEKLNEAFRLGNEDKEVYDNFDSNAAITPAPVTSEPPTLPPNKPVQPLKAISSIDKFIPSYAPPTAQVNPDPIDDHPSRTYSKFGIQDAPLYRYDHGSLDNNAFAYKRPHTSSGIYHHRYYNEPEEIPTSRIQNPYNYYSTNNNPQPNNNNDNKHRDSGIGMLPQLYKNNQFFYEDSSAALDSYEDYETYINPPSNVISTPASVTPRIKSYTSSTPKSSTRVTTFQFLGERVKLPSYNQQRATSTPKYKYAYLNNNRGTTSHRVTTERSTTASDYKPMVAPFPFNLPRVQDNRYNLGIKLSGCNVVGKMYSVGEVIDELSSECLRCMCSDIGVHCAERKC